MKRVLATAAAVSFAGGAFAADLPARGPALAPAPIFVSQFSWTGFYVGLNAGIAFGNNNNRCSSFFPVVTATGVPVAGFANAVCFNNNRNGDNAGFTGGIQAGYNYQIGSLVLGVEGDLNYRANEGRRGGGATEFLTVGAPAAFAGGYRVNDFRGGDNNFFGTARLRLGFAVNRALFYVTGGVAFGGDGNNRGGSASFHPTVALPIVLPPTATYTSVRRGNSDNVGFVIGGGMEYAFTIYWTVKAEYLYANLNNGRRGTNAYTCTDVVAGTCAGQAGTTFIDGNRRGRNGTSIARVGINYLFSTGGSAPVAARY